MRVTEIKEYSPEFKAGLRIGDEILTINGQRPVDFLDLFYYKDEPVEIEIKTNGVVKRLFINNLRGIGVDGKYRHCDNHCSFCFVDGLPKRLRRSLYFKDDDYRLSFLFGNYITMTNIDEQDLKRIGRLRLSPLYISVHTTDSDLRARMFGNPRASLILEQLKRLAELRVSFHTQVVVIPDLNDGGMLFKTIDDLIRFLPYLESIAIVPAGRTRYNGDLIPETTREYARNLIGSITTIKDSLRHQKGHDIVQISDEYYLLADLPFPDEARYGDFPQLENGCGMVVKLRKEIRNTKPATRSPDDLYLVTSRHPGFFLKPLLEHLTIPEDHVVQVENRLFGPTVWVAGLLSGRDVLETIKGMKGRFLIPADAAPDGIFIDDLRLDKYPDLIMAPRLIADLVETVEDL